MSKASLSLLALAGVEPYKEKKGEEYMNEHQVLHFKKSSKPGMIKLEMKRLEPLLICKTKRLISRIHPTEQHKKKSLAWNYARVIVNVN